MGKILQFVKLPVTLLVFLGFTGFLLSQNFSEIPIISGLKQEKQVAAEQDTFDPPEPPATYATAKYKSDKKSELSITAPAPIQVFVDANACSAEKVELGEPQITGNGTVTNDAPEIFPLGLTLVTWTLTGAENNMVTDSQEVMVIDTELPSITAPVDIETNTTEGSCLSSSVVLGEPVVKDNCTIKEIKNDAPSTFPIGETIITWTVIDNSDNSTTALQKVLVRDLQFPQITAPAAITQNVASGTCSVSGLQLGSPIVTDNCDNVSVSHNAPQNFPVGFTQVTWTAVDASGNSSIATQDITIMDIEKPVITAPAGIIISTSPGACIATTYNLGIAQATDNCSTVTISNNAPSQFPIGNTSVTWTATDASGNTATATQLVTVRDLENPVITAPSNLLINTNNNSCVATGVNLGTPVTTDNCGVKTISHNAPATFPKGITTVTWTVADHAGNITTASQIVTVQDKQAPVAPVLQNITWGCTYTVPTPVAADNCDTPIAGVPNRSSTFTSSGTITWTFTDAAGNSSTALQQITINPLNVDIAKKDILCNGFSNGEAQAIVTGGVAPFTYDWGSLGTASSITEIPPGNYSVTVKDKNGCQVTKAFTITEPATFVQISKIEVNSGCFGANNARLQVFAQGGTGSYSYFINNQAFNGTATNLSPGAYQVRVQDTNGCSAEQSVQIAAPAALTITGVSTTNTTAAGTATGTATVVVNGGTPNFTFLWSNGQTTQTARNLVAGTYSVTVRDANGCQVQRTNIRIYDPLFAEISVSSRCLSRQDALRTSFFNAINVTGGTGNYTYSWNFGENASLSPGTYSAGTHTVRYSTIGLKKVTLTVSDGITSFTADLDLYAGECFSSCGSNDLRAVGFYVGDNNGNKLSTGACSDSSQKSIWLEFEPGPDRYYMYIEYVFFVHHANGTFTEYSTASKCYDEYRSVSVPDKVKITNINFSCSDIISVEKVYVSVNVQRDRPCQSGSQPKCFSIDTVAPVEAPLFGTAIPSALLCNGASNGRITSRGSGGQAPYQYRLESSTGTVLRNYQTSGIFENLAAGTYRVTVRDNSTTPKTYTISNIVINQPANPLTLAIKSIIPLSCNGGNNASATVEASGGSSPYIYTWPNGQTGPTGTGLNAGNHVVRVIDKNGCEQTITVNITQPAVIVANAGPDVVVECGTTQVQLAAVFSGFNDPQTGNSQQGTWTLLNGPAGSTFSNNRLPNSLFTVTATGTYTLRWTVPCGNFDEVQINFGHCNNLDFDGINDYIDIGNHYNLSTLTTNGNFTLEAWIKLDASSSLSAKTILSKRDLGNTQGAGFDLIVENSIPKFRWSNNEISSKYPVNKNKWHHIAVVAGDSLKLFIDGLDVTSGEFGRITIDNNNRPFLIGATYNSSSPATPGNFFHGWIEEVRIWNTALSFSQLRFTMNQRLLINSNPVRGNILPATVTPPQEVNWSNLAGYYQLQVSEITNGITQDKAAVKVNGRLKNITTRQQNTAPLPYTTAKSGNWFSSDTWSQPVWWNLPANTGVKEKSIIKWNITTLFHDVNSGGKDIYVLGLLSESGKLNVLNPNGSLDEYNSGQLLQISHYLKLNGIIDLQGESQLIQEQGSVLEASSTGYLDIDQQGTQSSYNYNYFSSPVSTRGSANNGGYTIGSVLMDATDGLAEPKKIIFKPSHAAADGARSRPVTISSYWLYGYSPAAFNQYSEWDLVKETGRLESAEGFTMKGTSGVASIKDRQNYTFRGKPHNGNITLTIGKEQNYLVGNPYPSALDSHQFILDNLKDVIGGKNDKNAFDGSLYFWDHFSGKTHILKDYVGGYAVLNLTGGVAAISIDSRINNTGEPKSENRPDRYIPVGQAFLLSSAEEFDEDPDDDITPITIEGGDIYFNNNQRVFKRESTDPSMFLRPEKLPELEKAAGQDITKFRLSFKSPTGYHRQILVGAHPSTTNGFDLGYDARLFDYNEEDMYWIQGPNYLIIQGVPHFNQDQVLPLGLKVKTKENFTIQLDEVENAPAQFKVYLKDQVRDSIHNLSSAPYLTHDEPGYIHNRFQIIFHKEEPVVVVPDLPVKPTPPVIVVPQKPDVVTPSKELEIIYAHKSKEIQILNPELLKISQLELYDLKGSRVQTFTSIPASKEVNLPLNNYSSGVYIIKLITEENIINKKIIISN